MSHAEPLDPVNRVRAQFCVREFECADTEITRILGRQPDVVHHRGVPVDPRRATRSGGYPFNEWVIQIETRGKDIDSGDCVRVSSASLASIIRGFEPALKDLPSHTKIIRILISIYEDESPAIIFDASTLNVFARVGARLDVAQIDYRD